MSVKPQAPLRSVLRLQRYRLPDVEMDHFVNPQAPLRSVHAVIELLSSRRNLAFRIYNSAFHYAFRI